MDAIPVPRDKCTLEDLQLSINKLPYQINPIALQVKLLSCRNLSDKAKLIWQYLYTHSDYHTHKVVYIIKRIARCFNVTTRTIKRGMEQLLKYGWLEVTEYARHGGIDELQVLMPKHVFEEIITGEHRKEGPLNYENREREYCRDANGDVLFSYYINPNGSKTIVLNERLDIHAIASFLQTSIASDRVAANDAFDIGAHQVLEQESDNEPLEVDRVGQNSEQTIKPTELEIETKNKMDAINKQLASPKLSNAEKYDLLTKYRSLNFELTQLKNEREHQANKVDKIVPIPINKYISKITNNVAPFTSLAKTKPSRFLLSQNNQGESVPIRYKNASPVQIPQRYIDKVKQAIETHRTHISNPPGLLQEMLWAISRQFVGKPKDRPNPTINDIMRYNTDVAIKLVRENRWTMPAGFKSCEALESEKKAEYAKEREAKSRAGRFETVDAASEIASMAAILKKSGI